VKTHRAGIDYSVDLPDGSNCGAVNIDNAVERPVRLLCDRVVRQGRNVVVRRVGAAKVELALANGGGGKLEGENGGGDLALSDHFLEDRGAAKLRERLIAHSHQACVAKRRNRRKGQLSLKGKGRRESAPSWGSTVQLSVRVVAPAKVALLAVIPAMVTVSV
jgi:hypothetical protein